MLSCAASFADTDTSEVNMSIKAIARKRGFTLVELLIVIIIIAVIAAIAIPKFTNASLRSKESALKGELKLLRDGAELFKNDCGGYPVNLSDLALTTAPTNYESSAGAAVSIPSGAWKGPYVTNVDNDPVSNTAFRYTNTTGAILNSTSDGTTASDGTTYASW